jgi:CubicO group peptidase (beta-lactamase class C family)
VEMLSGDTLVHLLQTRVFEPLGMTSVLNTDAARLPPGDPIGYYRHALGPLRPAPEDGPGWMFAAGELAMSARDLALWNISVMDQSLLKPSSYAEMLKPVLLKDGTNSKYGLGFFVRTFKGETIYEHSGEVSGFVSENMVFPAKKVAITVLTNQDASAAASGIASAIGDILTGAAEETPAEVQALDIFTGLQAGRIDRSLFTGYCNAYFTQEAINDFASSLAPLGKPVSLKQAHEELRGGMTFRVFRVTFAAGSQPGDLAITTYTMPDGKIEQYLVEPGS